MINFVKDVLQSAKSKRVIAATVTAFFVASAQELGIPQDAALGIAALVVSLIIGDSMRAVSPDSDKYKTETGGNNGQA